MTRWQAILLLTAALLPTGCGYHVSGHGDLLPKTVQTIAIPPFGNATMRYKLADRLASSVAREMLSRTRYQIVSDESQADAVLRGSVQNIFSYGSVVDPSRGRTAAVQLNVVLSFSLQERSTGKTLFSRQNFTVQQRHDISTAEEDANRPQSVNVYFDESEAALQRLSREVAQTVVSAILEAF